MDFGLLNPKSGEDFVWDEWLRSYGQNRNSVKVWEFGQILKSFVFHRNIL